MDEMNNKSHLTEVLAQSMDKIREMVDVNTVVGEPIKTADGLTLIPISRVSFGFGNGGSDFSSQKGKGFGGGSGAGVKIEPIGFLIVKDGNVRMLNIMPPPTGTADRVLDMLPDIMDKVEGFAEKLKNKGETAGADVTTVENTAEK